jgi:DNA polymerase-1
VTKYLVLDLETTGLNPLTDKIHGIGVVWPDGKAEYLQSPSPELRMWLRNPEANIVGHNLRFDLKFLQVAGVEIRARLWDTKLLAQLINENQELGLKKLSEKYFGASSLEGKRELDRAVSSIVGKSVADLCRADIDAGYSRFCDVIAEYCIEDCYNTRNLWEKLVEDIKSRQGNWQKAGLKLNPLDYYVQETMPLENVLRHMEISGIKVNVEALLKYREQLQAENKKHMETLFTINKEKINVIEEKLYQEVCSKKKSEKGKTNVQRRSEKYGTLFNWQSADHLSDLIFTQYAFPVNLVEKTESGKLSTSEATLLNICQNKYISPELKSTLEIFGKWKKNLKLLTTYTGEDKGLMSQILNGRVHADYLQAGHGKESSQGGTVTGRLSSRNPNMQNLPRGSEIKRFFVPDPGQVFVYFDYSQLELRLAAHLSQDPLLIKAYREGLDLHQLTANAIGEDRQVGKTVNFAMIYDASPWRLTDIVNKPVEECEEIIENFYRLYSGYAKYLEIQKRKMCSGGWVSSETGRVRRLPELLQTKFGSREWKHALKQGYNFPIQSLGASITKRAMIELHRQGYQIVTQVHDSVVIQTPLPTCQAVAEKVRVIAESVYPCTVPIKADVKILTSLHEEDKLKENHDEQRSHNRKDSPGTASLA